jgi:Type II secretion system (T2SS), protein G
VVDKSPKMGFQHTCWALGLVVSILLGCSTDVLTTDYKRLTLTIGDIREISRLLETYSDSHGGLYPPPPSPPTKQYPFPWNTEGYPVLAWPVPSNRYASWLRPYLVPGIIKELPTNDHWGHPLLFDVSPDRKNYTIISVGKDGQMNARFAGTSWNFKNYNNDLIYSGGTTSRFGQFVSAPDGMTH